MTIAEFQILLDINKGNEQAVLEKHACSTHYGYFFVDSEDGQCYLLDKNGQLDDLKKIDAICENSIKKDIKKIAIPTSVKSIIKWTFAGCTSLIDVKIPNSVKTIGDYVFAYCWSLKSIDIPNSVKSIGEWAFINCASLTSIEIPDSVKSIGDEAFSFCKSLKRIEIPNSIESIGDEAFVDCESLTSIIFKNKTIDQVKAMDYYPWGIEDESIIKCS